MNETNHADRDGAQEQAIPAAPDAALAAAEAKAQENWNSYLRAVAELDNFRKRTERELENARKFAVERFAQELVTVGDARETVNGGTGIDTITVNAETIGATITASPAARRALARWSAPSSGISTDPSSR